MTATVSLHTKKLRRIHQETVRLAEKTHQAHEETLQIYEEIDRLAAENALQRARTIADSYWKSERWTKAKLRRRLREVQQDGGRNPIAAYLAATELAALEIIRTRLEAEQASPRRPPLQLVR